MLNFQTSHDTKENYGDDDINDDGGNVMMAVMSSDYNNRDVPGADR